MKMNTTVSVAMDRDPAVEADRVLAATELAEQDLFQLAALQGLELASSPVVVDQEMGYLEEDEYGHLYTRSVNTMTLDEQAAHICNPQRLILTFEATVVAIPAHAA